MDALAAAAEEVGLGPGPYDDVSGDEDTLLLSPPALEPAYAPESTSPASSAATPGPEAMEVAAGPGDGDLVTLLQAYLSATCSNVDPGYCRDVRVTSDPSAVFAKLRLQYRVPPLPGDAQHHLDDARARLGHVGSLQALIGFVNGRMEEDPAPEERTLPPVAATPSPWRGLAFRPAGSESDPSYGSPATSRASSMSSTPQSASSVGEGPKHMWCPDCCKDIPRTRRTTLRYHLISHHGYAGEALERMEAAAEAVRAEREARRARSKSKPRRTPASAPVVPSSGAGKRMSSSSSTSGKRALASSSSSASGKRAASPAVNPVRSRQKPEPRASLAARPQESAADDKAVITSLREENYTLRARLCAAERHLEDMRREMEAIHRFREKDRELLADLISGRIRLGAPAPVSR